MALAEALGRDPEFMLPGMHLGFKENGNPSFAWMAIDLCLKSKIEFPDWLISYLAHCSERMLSDKAKEAREERDVLPWILGFAGVSRPGNALDVDRDQHKKAFALAFAIRLDKGDDPPAARCNAYNDIFNREAADADDRTLQRWLLEVFGLKKSPPDWKNVVDEYYRPFMRKYRDLEQWAKSRGILS